MIQKRLSNYYDHGAVIAKFFLSQKIANEAGYPKSFKSELNLTFE